MNRPGPVGWAARGPVMTALAAVVLVVPTLRGAVEGRAGTTIATSAAAGEPS